MSGTFEYLDFSVAEIEYETFFYGNKLGFFPDFFHNRVLEFNALEKHQITHYENVKSAVSKRRFFYDI